MALQSSSLQTPASEALGSPNPVLDGQVTSLDVLDPTNSNRRTSLLDVTNPFEVQVHWELDGFDTLILGGGWIVSLYSDDMDGVGQMVGLIEGPAIIPVTGGPSPLKFHHRFHVNPPTPKVGLYTLTVTINHSPTSNPADLDEMFGFAESTPIDIK
jgi:hypothetical protein